MGPNFGPGPAFFDYGLYPPDHLPDDWELTHFGDLADNDDSDWDRDGRSSFMEWAMGLNPLSGNDPEPTRLTKTTGGLLLQYRRLKNAPPVAYLPQVSTDLATWHWNGDGSGVIYTTETDPPLDNGDGSETATVRILSPDASNPAVFGRVRVTPHQ
jgi:hypothetical protein